MTGRRVVRLILLPALVAAVLTGAVLAVTLSPSSTPGLRSPAPPSASPSPAPSPTPSPDEEVLQEIARDTVIGPRGSERDTAVEPYVAVDPNRPDVAVAVFQQGRFPDGGAAAVGFAASRDGGRTWTSGTIPGLTGVSGGTHLRVSDPTVAFGPEGSAYVSSIVIRGPDGEEGVVVNRSDDQGRTWRQPAFAERDPGGTHNDFPRVAVDTDPGSEHNGRVYVTYVRQGRAVLRWSDDRAITWSSITTVSPRAGLVPNVVAGPDGTLTVVYIVRRPREWPDLVSRSSRDGGRSFGPQVDIGEMRYHTSRGLRATGVEATAVDSLTGALYVVWSDATKRGDGVNDVVLSRSLDRGATWSPPAKVNPDAEGSGVNHVLPTVVARGGLVRVVYMTRPGSNRRPSQALQLRVIFSGDSGATFQGERAIGPPADLRYAAQVRPRRTRFLGDYIGVALTADSFLVVWSRSFPPAGVAGYHVTIWAAAIPEAADPVSWVIAGACAGRCWRAA
jgi:BNR repeat protein